MAVVEAINVRNGNGHLLSAIMKVCGAYYADQSLPDYYQEFYKLALGDKRSVVCVIRECEDIIGYILGIPQDSEAMQFVSVYDSNLVRDPGRYYVDTLEVMRSSKLSRYDFVALIRNLVEEVRKKGISNFSMYTRHDISEKLMRVLLRRIGGEIGPVRTIIADWYGRWERFDYLEATPW